MIKLCLKVSERWVGEGSPCFIIAEAGVNHNGSVDMALRLVEAAANAGADAVKFQTFRADSLVTPDAPKAEYQKRHTGHEESQRAMLTRLELDDSAWARIAAAAAERQILFLSTPFDEDSADSLAALDVPAFKISSGDLTNGRLLAHIAGLRRPVILSTGMASLGEVEAAIEILKSAGASEIALLHCVSSYPADPQDVNLRAMDTMAHAFGLPCGYSDHTVGVEVPWAAVARGAVIIEKHITLDKAMPGPDHAASADPAEFAILVRGIRTIEGALGDGRKQPAASELDVARASRRSIVARRRLTRGLVLTEEDLEFRRPGTGLPPSLLPHVIGRSVSRNIDAGELLTLDVLA